jgi:hypothetical protein
VPAMRNRRKSICGKMRSGVLRYPGSRRKGRRRENGRMPRADRPSPEFDSEAIATPSFNRSRLFRQSELPLTCGLVSVGQERRCHEHNLVVILQKLCNWASAPLSPAGIKHLANAELPVATFAATFGPGSLQRYPLPVVAERALHSIHCRLHLTSHKMRVHVSGQLE